LPATRRSRCRSTPSTNSIARKNSSASVRPKSKTWTTFACDSCIARRTSSKKRATKCGSPLDAVRMRLSATRFETPASVIALAATISAIPPSAIRPPMS
jgi:hypothetical protein